MRAKASVDLVRDLFMVDSPPALYIGKDGGANFDLFTRAGLTPFVKLRRLIREAGCDSVERDTLYPATYRQLKGSDPLMSIWEFLRKIYFPS